MFVSGGNKVGKGIDELKELSPNCSRKDDLPNHSFLLAFSYRGHQHLSVAVQALRRRHGDADPGVLARLAYKRLVETNRLLEAKALEAELAELRADLETLRLALRLERLRAEWKANFDPNQPRDEEGRWTEGRGGYAKNDYDSIVDDLESIVSFASDISGFTKHGIDEAITRGISPFDVLDALRNPLHVTTQSGDRLRYEGSGAVVVLNGDGKGITVWRKSR